MAEEVSIYQDSNIHITNLRAMLQGKTYAMANVTSVSMYTQFANKVPGVVVILVGIVFGLAGLGVREIRGCFIVFAVLLILVGAVYMHSARDVFWVRIGSASGETNALRSFDRAYVTRVVAAMNEAIVRRG